VVIVTLQSRRSARGTYPVQWPAEYVCDEPGEPIGNWMAIVGELLDICDAASDRERCSANALAADLGVPLTTVFRWLAGESRPAAELIARVAEWVRERR